MTVGSVVTSDAGAATRRATWADVRLLGWIVLTDLVFVGGVLVPYLTRAAVGGFAAYVSPVGVAAVRWFLD